MIKIRIFLILSVLFFNCINSAPTEDGTKDNYKLIILHNNDIHSRFMETNVYSSPCKSSDPSKCFGGAARSVSLVKKIRQSVGHDHVLYLNAGDHFQGTIWYNLWKWKAVTDFVINMEYDALTLGNHEFDDGVAGVLPYINHVQNATFSNGTISQHPPTPIVVCNLDVSNEPRLLKEDGSSIMNKSIIIEKDGKLIGIIGYITPDTAFLSSPGKNVTFLNEVESVRKEVNYLKSLNIKIIILMSHGGFKADINVAKEVQDIDIIVGGHTNTFLFTPKANNTNEFDPHAGESSMKAPSIEKPLDEYPTVISARDGAKTLIVQSFAYGKYLGYLDVDFDSNGNIIKYQGNPILLDGAVEEDVQTLEMINFWSKEEPKEFKAIIGTSSIFIEGEDIVCRTRECTLGNLYTDMLVQYFLENFGCENAKYSLLEPEVEEEQEESTGWDKYPVALINSGLIRTSIAPGDIALEDIMTVLPFNNSFEVIKVTGSSLLEAIEHSVSAYDASGQRTEGRFLQFSGIKVKYNIYKESGHRVEKVLIRTGNELEVEYEQLNKLKTYNVISSKYVDDGGDGYKMFINATRMTCPVCPGCPSCLDVDIMKEFAEKWSPLTAEIEGRIKFVGSPSSAVNHVNLSMVPGIILVLVIKYIIN